MREFETIGKIYYVAELEMSNIEPVNFTLRVLIISMILIVICPSAAKLGIGLLTKESQW